MIDMVKLHGNVKIIYYHGCILAPEICQNVWTSIKVSSERNLLFLPMAYY